jgi:hypothetical protein
MVFHYRLIPVGADKSASWVAGVFCYILLPAKPGFSFAIVADKRQEILKKQSKVHIHKDTI